MVSGLLAGDLAVSIRITNAYTLGPHDSASGKNSQR